MDAAYPEFSWALASAYLREMKENACVSPYGVFQLLSVIAEGADGATRLEFDRLLRRPEGRGHGEAAKALRVLLQDPPALNDRTTVIAQKLFPSYEEILRNVFGESLTLSPADSKDICLIHEIRFKDHWRYRFQDTERVFYPDPGGEAAPGAVIPFIYREAVSLRWWETDAFLSAEVPFSSDLHMTLSMPKRRPLRDCLGDPKCLAEMLTAPSPHPGLFFLMDAPSPADLCLPSFRIDSHIDLTGLLRDMGLSRAFDETSAELTGIAGECQYIRSARQDTIVEVNAEGAAAYAKTAFLLTTLGSMPGIKPLPKQLCFDRPFLFAVWKNAPDPAPLFVGAFQKPPCPQSNNITDRKRLARFDKEIF